MFAAAHLKNNASFVAQLLGRPPPKPRAPGHGGGGGGSGGRVPRPGEVDDDNADSEGPDLDAEDASLVQRAFEILGEHYKASRYVEYIEMRRRYGEYRSRLPASL